MPLGSGVFDHWLCEVLSKTFNRVCLDGGHLVGVHGEQRIPLADDDGSAPVGAQAYPLT